MVAARTAAGAVVDGVHRVLDGRANHAFAVVRPPGHHAEHARAMGFCLVNNVAVGLYAAREKSIRRIAILDFDVHHGNGTQHSVADDADVFYASPHQYPFYPGTGALSDRGGPEASGLTVNVPLAAGASARTWLAGFDAAVEPALRAFEPELVVVSCGFDAHRDDPLAELQLDTETYAAVAERLVSLTGLPCAGRTVWVLEGGYDLEALTTSTQAVLEVLVAA